MSHFSASHTRALQLALLLAATLLTQLARVSADEAAKDEPVIHPEDREHWAYRPLANPPVPTVNRGDWPRNPIDHFILARLEADGLSPAPPADGIALLRRVTIDLTGLPPTPDEVDAFLADKASDACERVIDRLLASPAYGQRWAQHWLDLARFAETDGFEHDLMRPNAWKYRDWLIQALNDDMPYDTFVQLQIAGDALKPDDASAALATGFLLSGPDMPDINLPEERRHMVLNEIAGTVGSVFLGLQIGCAECHDHKFDAISQADFYRLRSFFNSGLQLADHSKDRVFKETTKEPVESFLMVRGDFRRPGPKVEPAFPRVANATDDRPEGSGRAALAKWLTRPDNPLSTRVIVNRLWQQHFGRGLSSTPSDFGIMGEEPSHGELLDWLAGEFSRRGWSLKQMHKLMLTSATYQQTSYLADKENLSDASSAAEAWELAKSTDPENRLLWRTNRQRLDGETIRDCMLMASERLSPRTGGPGVRPPMPDELVKTLLKDHWQVSPDEEDHRRRSVYLFVRRNLRYPIFEVFDRPDASASCSRRSRSTTALQSLTLLNSEFSLQRARELADYIAQRAGNDPAARVELAYRRTLARRPTADELDRAVKYLSDRETAVAAETSAEGTHSPDHASPLVQLCLAMFNLSEFVVVD